MKGTGSCDSSHDSRLCEPQSQVELVVCSVTHSFNSDQEPARPHSLDDRMAIAVVVTLRRLN